MNWYKLAQDNTFERGDKVKLTEKHPNPSVKRIGRDIENQYFVDDNEESYFLSQYPVKFEDRAGSVHQYNKFYYNLEKV